jgi:hypothetical protein
MLKNKSVNSRDTTVLVGYANNLFEDIGESIIEDSKISSCMTQVE